MRRRTKTITLLAATASSALLATVVGLVLVGGGGEPAPAATSTAAVPPTGGAATGASASPNDGLTPAERRLVASLGPFRVHDCRPAAPDQPDETGQQTPGSAVDAAVRCPTTVEAGEPGPAELLARHYRDPAAMTADVSRRTAAITDIGSCSQGEPSTETWGRSTRRLGTFLCGRPAADTFAIFWTADGDRTAFSAASNDPAGLLTWWRDFTKP
jgi:hypothetical protein